MESVKPELKHNCKVKKCCSIIQQWKIANTYWM